MEIVTKTPDIEIKDLKDEVDIEIEVPVIEIEPTTPELELEVGGSVINVVDDYEKLKNIPSINDVPLLGNKTTEELGIEASGGVKSVEVNNSNVVDENGIAKIKVPRDLGELTNNVGYVNKNSTSLEYYYTKTQTDNKINALPLGTEINIKDTFEYLKRFQNNDIYNANAVNSSVDWIIQAILEAFNREVLVDINVVVNPQTFQVISNDGSYSDVANTLDLGGTTRVVCQLAGTNIKLVLQLAMVDGTYAYFTTVMKANLGAGEMKYLLGINISERYTKVIVEPLA